MAEETPTLVHRQIGSGEPQGWDYQLDNELIFDLVTSTSGATTCSAPKRD